jgi:hypothetical protein
MDVCPWVASELGSCESEEGVLKKWRCDDGAKPSMTSDTRTSRRGSLHKADVQSHGERVVVRYDSVDNPSSIKGQSKAPCTKKSQFLFAWPLGLFLNP